MMKRATILICLFAAMAAILSFVAVELYRGRDQLMAEGLQTQIEKALPENASQSDVLSYLDSIGASARVTTSDNLDSLTNYNGIKPGTPGVRASFDQTGTWFLYPNRHFEIFIVLKDGIAQRIVVEEYSGP